MTLMAANSKKTTGRGDWDTTQLLDVIHHPRGPERTLAVLMSFISTRNYVEIARRLKKEDVVKLVDAIDQVRCVLLGQGYPLDDDFDDQAIGPTDSRKPQNLALLGALGSICSATARLPHTIILSNGVEKCGDIAAASGGFTDTWRGRYKTKAVALKAFRTYPSQDLKEAKKVCRTNLGDIASLPHEPRRSCGRKSSFGNGCPMNMFCGSTVSTGGISSLPSSMTGRTLAISSSTWIRIPETRAPAWYRYHH